MSKSKHTPGQWAWRRSRVDERDIVIEAPGEHIATIEFTNSGIAIEEQKRMVADATLIASAPEMLRCLNVVHAWMIANKIDGVMPETVAKVIAKAEGGE